MSKQMKQQITHSLKEWTKCELEPLRLKMGCNLVVPGVGPMNANLMLVGEAPGADEDLQDEPFVGRAGDLLNKILQDSGLSRSEAYITNIVKCRPTIDNKQKKNRPPTVEEIAACKKVLWRELQTVAPAAIITLGATATKTLLSKCAELYSFNSKFKMEDYVGQVCGVPYMKAKIIPAYHPSYLLQHGKHLLDKEIEIFKFVKWRILDKELNQ